MLWILTDGKYTNTKGFAGQGNNQMLVGDPVTHVVGRRGAPELVESQEPERVAHEHRQAAMPGVGIAQPAKDERERGQPEIGFRLAAAGREEQKVDDLALAVGGTRAGRAAMQADPPPPVRGHAPVRSVAAPPRPSPDWRCGTPPADRDRRAGRCRPGYDPPHRRPGSPACRQPPGAGRRRPSPPPAGLRSSRDRRGPGGSGRASHPPRRSGRRAPPCQARHRGSAMARPVPPPPGASIPSAPAGIRHPPCRCGWTRCGRRRTRPHPDSAGRRGDRPSRRCRGRAGRIAGRTDGPR